ncbi:MAG: hypothetical protein IID46_12040 [Planctomycetes bacterium]|nr:hypothetical protein [Planctomycetota bacterium]
MGLARKLIEQSADDAARRYLAAIVENYPNTSAAKEAQKLLEELRE